MRWPWNGASDTHGKTKPNRDRSVTWQCAGNGVNLERRKWIIATWQRQGAGKRLALQGNVFAVTWESSDGKAVKAHSVVLCPDGPCFTQVLTPSKWSKATWPGAGKGLPLQGNVFAVTCEGNGKAVKAHRGVLCPDGPCFAHVLKPSKWSMATGQALAKGCRCRATCSR